MNDKIDTQSGETVEAQASVIISASRSTDIPAFYAKWFINRLKAGYVVWYNPFNRQPVYISFKNCKVVVFWTKNPKPVIPYLHELDERGIHYYFQFTMNDYDNEHFEPYVPPIQKRIETFKELSQLIGKEKVIWRFDPLIITSQLSPRDLLKKIWNIGNQIKGDTDKLVFSFVDINTYRKVQSNLVKETAFFSKETVEHSEFTQEQMNEIADGLAKYRDAWAKEGWQISLATCAEKVDLQQYGIEHNRCIDGELMKRIFTEDKDLVYYLNFGKLPERNTLFYNEISLKLLLPEKLKDKGQRKVCGCMISKDIGMYNTCRHFCVYCYANTSRKTVEANGTKQNENNESIIMINNILDKGAKNGK
jgi:DNA repair photolyase